MTVGLVQKEIRVGMTGAEVAAALGSPNIVTRDNKGKESWVYDKIATEASYSQSSGGGGASAGGAGLTGGNVLLLGTLSGNYGRQSGASATTQKTLTVIIRFDDNSTVESFSYHSSTF
ncbi:MAG: outer membrane protein assembly factor BamE [bacterium]|nr:outer membrane protein assembly factor BamE [bacterium]